MKHFKRIFVLVLAFFCFAGLALTGCSSNNTKTVTVIAYIDGVETERKNIDIFNNAILTPPSDDKTPTGKVFYGWSTSENWDETSDDFVVEGNFISYNNVRKHAKNGEVKLYPAYKAKVEKYFVFGWYIKTSTSGLNENTMSDIETALKDYLRTKGATDEQLALVDVRGYDGDVGTYGAKIMADGDVDVFLGCGSNINATSGTSGNVTLVKKSGAMTLNGVTGRRFILMNYEDLAIDVYNWFQNYVHENLDPTYVPEVFVKPATCNITFNLGNNAAATTVCPTGFSIFADEKFTLPEAVEAAEGYTFIGWKVGDTVYDAGASVSVSATTEIVAQFRSNALIEVSYSNGLKTRTAATTAPESDVVAPGTEITLPAAPTAKPGFVFAGWRVGTELNAAGSQVVVNENTTITAEYVVDTTVDLTITIGYYQNKNGGFTENDPVINDVKTVGKKLKDEDLSFIKCIICGGDSLSTALNKRIDDFLESHNSKTKVRTAFGMTEATAGVTMMPLEESRRESIGVPIPDSFIKIVKPGTEEELKPLEIGEICISGPTVMKGYLNEKEETDLILKKHKDKKLWLHSGDLGYMDSDGFVYFKSRLKRMIVSSGYNIYPGQIEEIISSHPYVKTCAVVGVPHPYKKEVIKAYIVLKDNIELTSEVKRSIKSYCEKNIASYSLPYAYGYRKELPKTLVGKVAYRKLLNDEEE